MEIKFRVWDNETQSFWSEGRDLKLVSMVADSLVNDDSTVLEQYTGLKDKNGVDIYQNDIIEIFDTSYGDNEKHYGVVAYSEYAELVVGNILLSRVYKAIKVIGNTHENPELLEGV